MMDASVFRNVWEESDMMSVPVLVLLTVLMMLVLVLISILLSMSINFEILSGCFKNDLFLSSCSEFEFLNGVRFADSEV